MAREKVPQPPEEKKDPPKTVNRRNEDNSKVEKFLFGFQNKKFTQSHIEEFQKIYNSMDPDLFMEKLLQVFQVVINQDLKSRRADNILQFFVSFMISCEGEETHPIWASFFNWLLNTKSVQTHVRVRMCQFVGQFLSSLNMDAVLDDNICEGIERYMILNAEDFSNLVRVQALSGLQRLQDPSNINATTWKHYFYHLHDPASNVREAVITNICKNRFSIPKLLDHLMDRVESVRKHLIQSLVNVSYKHYKTEDRIRLLEEGLEGQIDVVKKSIQETVITSWFSEMGQNYLKLVKNLLLENSWTDFKRSVDIAKKVLKLIFSKNSNYVKYFWEQMTATEMEEDMERICQSVENTQLSDVQSKNEKWENCIDLSRLSLEFSVFWLAVLEYSNENEDASEVPFPDLADYLSFMERFSAKYLTVVYEMKKKKKYHYIFNVLVDILGGYDVSDEICRDQIKARVKSLILSHRVKKNTLTKLIKLYGQVFPDNDQYLNNICSDIREQLSNTMNDTETSGLEISASLRQPETMSKLRQNLKVVYILLTERKITHLTGLVRDLFSTIICPRIENGDRKVRIWATKCTSTYASLEPGVAKEFYCSLIAQLQVQQNIPVWAVVIESIFDLMTQYGIEFLSDSNPNRKPNRDRDSRGRALYNTTSECWLGKADESMEQINILDILQKLYDDCTDMVLVRPLVIGFCRLILSGQCQSVELMTKLLVTFFGPETDPELVQILSIFFLDVCENQMQELIVLSLLSTLQYIGDNCLNIDMEKIIQFAVNSTEPKSCLPDTHFHSKLATIFLNMIKYNDKYKSLVKILVKTVNRLEITADQEYKNDLKQLIQELISDGYLKEDQIEDLNNKLVASQHSEAIESQNEIEFSQSQTSEKISAIETSPIEKESSAIVEESTEKSSSEKKEILQDKSPICREVVEDNEKTEIVPMKTVTEESESEISRSSSKENLNQADNLISTRRTAIPNLVRKNLSESLEQDLNVSGGGRRLRRDANSKIPVKTTDSKNPARLDNKRVKRVLEKSTTNQTPKLKHIRMEKTTNSSKKTVQNDHIFKTPTKSPVRNATKKATSTPNGYSARIVLTPLDISEVNHSRKPPTRSTTNSSLSSSSRTLRSRTNSTSSTTTSTTNNKKFLQEMIPNRNRLTRKNR